MKFIILVLVSFFVFSSSICSAQYTPEEAYDRESIFLQVQPFVGARYVKDGVMKPAGFFYNKMAEDMEVSPNAVMLLKKSRQNAVWANVAALIGGISFAAAVTDEENSTPWLLSTVAFSVTSGVLALKSNNQLNKSVWYYNRDVVQGQLSK
jgi:hypothetical protein